MSGRASWLKIILFKIPFLYKRQDCGNYHFFRDKYCFCRVNCFCGNWRGGVQDLKTKEEIPYINIYKDKYDNEPY